MKLKRERFRSVGLYFAAHGLRHVFYLHREQACWRVGLHVELRRGFHAHEAVEQRRLRRRERKARKRVLPRFHVALGDDGDGELRDALVFRWLHRCVGRRWLRGFFQPQDQRARAVRFPADTPILQPFSGHLLDFALASNRERQLLRLALHDVERHRERMRELVARDFDRVLHRGGENQLVLAGRASGEIALDRHLQFSIRDSAADGRVFDFRLVLRERCDGREQECDGEECDLA